MTAFTWRSASATAQGNVRAHNEDAILELPALGLWVVADGMGGHDAGDVASRMVVEALCVLPRSHCLRELLDHVERRLRLVNERLYRLSLEAGRGMIGTTVAALLAFDSYCLSVWAGDSRVYRLRGGSLARITSDHSEIQSLLDEGLIDAEEAACRDASNVITRAVGGARELHLDLELRELQHGDRYLLCSDGLYKEVGEGDLGKHLARDDVDKACKGLMSQALGGPCRDNVSVIAVEFSLSSGDVLAAARCAPGGADRTGGARSADGAGSAEAAGGARTVMGAPGPGDAPDLGDAPALGGGAVADSGGASRVPGHIAGVCEDVAPRLRSLAKAYAHGRLTLESYHQLRAQLLDSLAGTTPSAPAGGALDPARSRDGGRTVDPRDVAASGQPTSIRGCIGAGQAADAGSLAGAEQVVGAGRGAGAGDSIGAGRGAIVGDLVGGGQAAGVGSLVGAGQVVGAGRGAGNGSLVGVGQVAGVRRAAGPRGLGGSWGGRRRAAARWVGMVVLVAVVGAAIGAWLIHDKPGAASGSESDLKTFSRRGSGSSARIFQLVEPLLDDPDWSEARIASVNAGLLEEGSRRIAAEQGTEWFRRFAEEVRLRLKEQQARDTNRLAADKSPLAALAVTIGLDLDALDAPLHLPVRVDFQDARQRRRP